MLETTETLLNGLIAGDQAKWARLYRDYAPTNMFVPIFNVSPDSELIEE